MVLNCTDCIDPTKAIQVLWQPHVIPLPPPQPPPPPKKKERTISSVPIEYVLLPIQLYQF